MSKTRAELIEIVRRLQTAQGTDAELDELAETLRASVPHPRVLDLIFWDTRTLTAEEVVDEALAHDPLITPAPRS